MSSPPGRVSVQGWEGWGAVAGGRKQVVCLSVATRPELGARYDVENVQIHTIGS